MRKILLSFAAVFYFFNLLHGQSITPQVINSTGGTFKDRDEEFFIDWNVGEMALVNTMAGATNHQLFIVTNGFLQPFRRRGEDDGGNQGNKILTFSPSEIKVFPNPTVNYIEVDLFAVEGKVLITLYSQTGQKLYQRESYPNSHNRVERIPMTGYTPGSYLLNIQSEGSSATPAKSGSYKIVKTD
jgi:hypothetical protein